MGQGCRAVCGVDEVGRGPLAGPVVAAAVILPDSFAAEGLTDSKKLTANRRVELDAIIREHALSFAIAQASVAEIDEINILQASLLAMRRAVSGLHRPADGVLVDGIHDPGFGRPTLCIKKGDSRSLSIAAASVLAKVYRDALMQQLDAQYPGYGWGTNAGYGSRHHIETLQLVGVTPHHRKSFKPVRDVLDRKTAPSN